MILIHLTKKVVFLWHHIIHQVEEETQIWNDANLKVSGILERRERDNIEDQVSSNTQEIGIQWEKNKGKKSCSNVVINGAGGKKIQEWMACFMFLKVQHLNNPIWKILIWKRFVFWSWGQKMNVITPCVCYILLYILNTTWSYLKLKTTESLSETGQGKSWWRDVSKKGKTQRFLCFERAMGKMGDCVCGSCFKLHCVVCIMFHYFFERHSCVSTST